MELERYRELFLAEARDHLEAAFQLQARLETQPDDRSSREDLLRRAHSLKGMAATMGFDSLVTLAHAMEEFLGRVGCADTPALHGRISLLAESIACMSRMVDRVERGEGAASRRADELAREWSASSPGRSRPATVAAVPPPVAPRQVAAAPRRDETTYWRIELLLDDRPARSAEMTVSILRDLAGLGRVVHVDPPRVDLQTGRFEGRLVLVLASARGHEQLERELRRVPGIQGCAVAAEAAPPARPRQEHPRHWIRVPAEQVDALFEGLQELRVEQARLRASLPRPGRAAMHLLERVDSRLAEVSGTVMELRLVPFESVARRLHQTVHELARQLDKDVRFELVGEQVHLDRAILDELLDPLLHLVRNALDHGLESRSGRRAAGKPARGVLRLELERRGQRVQIRIHDDGRGICAQALKAAAQRAGLISAAEAGALSHAQALMLTTRTGLSTADRVTHVSGRGIGLDVVRDRVERLGGRIDIESEPSRGTTITLDVPMRMALVQSLLVRSAGELFAVPIDAVEQALESDKSDGSLVVRLREGGDLVVDEVLGRREILVKPFQPPLGSLPPYSGAAVLENGTIALVVDPRQVLESPIRRA